MDYPVYRSTYTAAQIEAAIGKGPIIVDGYWAVWDITASEYVNTGVQATGDAIIAEMAGVTAGDALIASAVDVHGAPTALIGQPIQPVIRHTSLSVPGTWDGSDPYYTVPTIQGEITANTKIDIQPTAEQLQALAVYGVTALTVENDNGSPLIWAIGAHPDAMELQCTLTEVAG